MTRPVRGMHRPERTCSGCRATRPKRELIRLVLPASPSTGPVIVDPTGKAEGRGAYVCADTAVECLARARRRGALVKALRTVPERVDTAALTAAVAAVAAAAAATAGTDPSLSTTEAPPVAGEGPRAALEVSSSPL